MISALRQNWKPLLLLAVLSFVLIFWHLGSTTLWQGDEGIYAEIAREMHESGNIITPHYNYAPRFDKPPLYFWLTSLLYMFLGISEFTVRFWPAFFGFATVMLTYLMGTRLWNRATGLISAVVMLTCMQNVVQSRVAIMDTMLTFWLLLCIYCLINWYRDNNWKQFYIASIAAGFAVLVKGPVGVIFPAVVLGISLLIKKDLKRVLNPRVLTGFILFILIAAPWYIAAYIQNGAVFINDFFGYQNIARYTKAIEQHGAPWFFYFIILFAGFFPWSPFLLIPGAKLVEKITNMGSGTKDQGSVKTHHSNISFESIFFIVWSLFIFVFFSFSQSKLPGYIFPIFPVLALSVGKGIKEGIEQLGNIGTKRLVYGSFVLFLICTGLLITAMVYVLKITPPSETPIDITLLYPLIIILTAGAVLTLLSLIRIKYSRVIITLTITLFFGFMVNSILPQMERDKGINSIGKYIHKTISGNTRVGAYINVEPREVFYARRKIDLLKEENDLFDFINKPEHVVILKRKDYLSLVKKGNKGYKLIYTTGDYALIRGNSK
ncbi:MAG: glycosyltransferase family 39 protein [Candidatus Margulisiibacteriota bacterium]